MFFFSISSQRLRHALLHNVLSREVITAGEFEIFFVALILALLFRDWFFAHLPNARTCQKCKQIVVCNTASRSSKIATASKKRKEKCKKDSLWLEILGYYWHCCWVSFVKWKSCLIIYFCLSVGSSFVTFSKDLRTNNVLSRYVIIKWCRWT